MFNILTRLVPWGKTDTSAAAAASVSGKAPSLRELILVYIKEAPATTDETCNALDLPVQTVTARVWELRKLGKIKDSGKRRTTSRGRAAIVWRAV